MAMQPPLLTTQKLVPITKIVSTPEKGYAFPQLLVGHTSFDMGLRHSPSLQASSTVYWATDVGHKIPTFLYPIGGCNADVLLV